VTEFPRFTHVPITIQRYHHTRSGFSALHRKLFFANSRQLRIWPVHHRFSSNINLFKSIASEIFTLMVGHTTWAEAHGLAPEVFASQRYNAFYSPANLATINNPQIIIADSNKHPNFWHLNILVLSAVLEVVCVSLPGYIIARQGLFDAEAQKFLANLNVMLFTPCLSELLRYTYQWFHG
jgi:hypothetical protein